MRTLYLSLLTILTFTSILYSSETEAQAVSTMTCEIFDGSPHNWQSVNGNMHVNQWIYFTDENGESYIFNDDAPYHGNFNCVDICFDYRVGDDGDDGADDVIGIHPRFTIYAGGNSPLNATIMASFLGPDPVYEFQEDFTTVCMSIRDDEMPEGWIMDVGSDDQWSTLVNDVEGIAFRADFAEQGTPATIREKFWVDNICYESLGEATAYAHLEHEDGTIDEEFCFGEDIFLDPRPTTGDYYRYKLHVEFPDQGTHIATNWSTDVPFDDRINLNDVIGLFGDPDDNTASFIPGSYTAVLAVSSDCESWNQIRIGFTVKCCREYEPDPSFWLTVEDPNDIYFNLKAFDYDLYENLDATHEWYYFTSPDPEGTPYTPIAIETGNEFSYFPAESGAINHHVLHKIITPCGEYCYLKSIQTSKGLKEFKDNLTPEPRPCDLIDSVFTDCSKLPSPENLSVVGDFLVWSPVQGATEYIVTITTGQSNCCDDEGFPQGYQFIVTSSSLELPKPLRTKCFEWTVTAVCPKGKSGPSRAACHPGTKSTKVRSDDFDINNVVDAIIYPNPASHEINFIIDITTVDSSNYTVDLINATGQLILSQKYSSDITNGVVDVSQIESGYYLLRIERSNENVIYKKVIITN